MIDNRLAIAGELTWQEVVVLIPRERARSALGYIQSSAKISSEDMPSS